MQIIINFDTKSPLNCIRKCEKTFSHFQRATIFNAIRAFFNFCHIFSTKKIFQMKKLRDKSLKIKKSEIAILFEIK